MIKCCNRHHTQSIRKLTAGMEQVGTAMMMILKMKWGAHTANITRWAQGINTGSKFGRNCAQQKGANGHLNICDLHFTYTWMDFRMKGVPFYCKTLIFRETLFSRARGLWFIHETLFSRLSIFCTTCINLVWEINFVSVWSCEFMRK